MPDFFIPCSVAKFVVSEIIRYICHTIEKVMKGETLKLLRDANHFRQEDVADYLGIKRSTYSNYETGDREAPWVVLEKLANLYGCDQYDLESENQDVLQGVIACAFRVDSMSVEDMKQVAAFKQLVMNYVKMKKIAER